MGGLLEGVGGHRWREFRNALFEGGGGAKKGAFARGQQALCGQRNFWSTLSTQMSDLKRLLLASSPLSRRLANET